MESDRAAKYFSAEEMTFVCKMCSCALHPERNKLYFIESCKSDVCQECINQLRA
jgi:hypothetical protein